MSRCKDCLHYDACLTFSKIINSARNVEEGCEHFKNKDNYKEIVRGEWINTYMDMVCSVCGQTFSDELPMMYKFNYQEPHYCPNCGSIMDGKKENQCQTQSV